MTNSPTQVSSNRDSTSRLFKNFYYIDVSVDPYKFQNFVKRNILCRFAGDPNKYFRFGEVEDYNKFLKFFESALYLYIIINFHKERSLMGKQDKCYEKAIQILKEYDEFKIPKFFRNIFRRICSVANNSEATFFPDIKHPALNEDRKHYLDVIGDDPNFRYRFYKALERNNLELVSIADPDRTIYLSPKGIKIVGYSSVRRTMETIVYKLDWSDDLMEDLFVEVLEGCRKDPKRLYEYDTRI